MDTYTCTVYVKRKQTIREQVRHLPVHHMPPPGHAEQLEPPGCSDRTTGSPATPSPTY